MGERKVLELNARTRKYFLHCGDERLHKLVILRTCHATLAKAQVKRVGKQALVVGTYVQRDRQCQMRRNASAGGIKRKFPDRDAHAVHPKIAQTQNAFTVSDD